MTTGPIPLRVSFAELEINAYEERLLAQLEHEQAMLGPEPFDWNAERARRMGVPSRKEVEWLMACAP